jgi:hypothetical protein
MAAANDADNATTSPIKFHKLNEIELNHKLSDIHSIFSRVDEFRKQIYFMIITLRSTWTNSEFITVGIGALAILIGAITFDGELQQGGDYLKVGISPLGTGLSAVAPASFFQLILSMICWTYFLYRLWNHYPLMRGQSVSLIVMWISITILAIGLHQGAPTFPFEISSEGITIMSGALITAIFLGFVFSRAVIETRDLHVEEKHQNRDPRIMAESIYNHSLFGWVGILIIWSIAAFISSWAGAHYVAVRPHSSWFWQFLYILFGAISISGICVLLWYPQLMLGTGEITIKSKRAREIDDMQIEVGAWKDEQGKCPECKSPSPIFRGKNGLPRLKCINDNCGGEGALNSDCPICKSKIPLRIKCKNCGVSTPALKHLRDHEAW